MAREITLPSTSTFIQDFGLNVTPEQVNRNKRVVIIGTAEDGPMYEPIPINKPEDAEFIWGSLTSGDLVRGIFEAWDVQDGTPNIVGLRIGNGQKAKLDIYEADGSGVNAKTGNTVALSLESRFPGQIYNQITIGYNDNRELAIFNPKTGLTTVMSVDTINPRNQNANVHNVEELVNIINSDRNLSSVLTASFKPLTSDFEVAIASDNTSVIRNTEGEVVIDLQKLLFDDTNVVEDGYMVPKPTGATVTASNNIINLLEVESVSISEWTNIDVINGKAKLPLTPLDGKRSIEYNTIRCLDDYALDNKWAKVGPNVISEYIQSINFKPAFAGGDNLLGLTIEKGINGENILQIDTDLCLDDSDEINGNSVAESFIKSDLTYTTTYGISDPDVDDDWEKATCKGIASKIENGQTLKPTGNISIFVSRDPSVNGFWTKLPYSFEKGIYMESYDSISGVATFKIATPVGEEHSGAMLELVDKDGNILPDRYVRISAHTIKGFMVEANSLPEVTEMRAIDPGTGKATGAIKYFVSGNQLTFNDNFAYPIIINYGTKISYEIGSSVYLDDANKGIVKFSTYNQLPGPGGKKLDDRNSYIRFSYEFMPNFPKITAKAQTLYGGTNGNLLNAGQRYDELTKTYEKLLNYTADIFVPMGAYIDATTNRYNPITGLKEEVPVGFHVQLEDFLDNLSINSIQPHAVLGVAPLLETTQEAKDKWIERLTVTDMNDPTRGANIMSLIQNKFISVVAFEPVFFNIGRGRPYTHNGQASYAGFISSIPYNISPTNKSIPGIRNIRFDYSVSQLESLNAMRYVMMKSRTNGTPVIIEDVTAAPFGSDFTNWSIFSITAAASNRVKAIANEFIGRPNSIEVRSALDQLISNALMSMEGLRAFDFSINSSDNQQVLGIVEIDLILVPIFTIKKIRTTVKLRKNLQNR